MSSTPFLVSSFFLFFSFLSFSFSFLFFSSLSFSFLFFFCFFFPFPQIRGRRVRKISLRFRVQCDPIRPALFLSCIPDDGQTLACEKKRAVSVLRYQAGPTEPASEMTCRLEG